MSANGPVARDPFANGYPSAIPVRERDGPVRGRVVFANGYLHMYVVRNEAESAAYFCGG